MLIPSPIRLATMATEDLILLVIKHLEEVKLPMLQDEGDVAIALTMVEGLNEWLKDPLMREIKSDMQVRIDCMRYISRQKRLL